MKVRRRSSAAVVRLTRALSSTWLVVLLPLALVPVAAIAQVRYSTGGVSNYPANPCGGPNLPLAVPEARAFQTWYNLAGHQVVSRWENGDVWGSDFREGTAGTADLEPQGGSDLPDVYFYTGHGICQNPPTATDGDFIAVCGNFGTPDTTRIGQSSGWGNAAGRLRFMLIDASCPMDLVSLTNEWFSPFRGLHLATGHSGDRNHDTLDSSSRGDQFAVRTVGWSIDFPIIGKLTIIPQLSVGNAWMATGLIDVQSQVCAVATAAGDTEQDAVNRRENERVTSNWVKPSNNWLAWMWVCN